MGRYDNTKRNQYNSTPRKVFDTYIDRIAIKRQRDREDHRNDMQTVLQYLKALEERLHLLEEHVQQHCDALGDLIGTLDYHGSRKPGTEEL